MAPPSTGHDASRANTQGDGVPAARLHLASWPVAPHPMRGARRAVVLASHRTQAEIETLLAWLRIDLTFVSRVDLLSDWVESNCPEVVMIDTDLLGLPADLCVMARSLRPDVLTVALVNHWSEREERLHNAVDAVLHKPPRPEEWKRLFG